MIEPVYQTERVTVYHGNCLDVIPQLEPDSVDAVITDPPYEAEAHTLGRRMMAGGKIAKAPLTFNQMDEETRQEFSKLCEMVCFGWVLVFCQAEAVSLWRDALTAGGVTYKRPMIWVKPDGAPQFTGDRPGMGYESIVAAWSGAGKSVWNGGGRHGVFIYSRQCRKGLNRHPTEKPEPLMLDLVRLFTNPGNHILDPFAGSGTTCVAALRQGCRCTAIEIEQKYIDIIIRRVEAEESQGRLF